MTRSKMFKIAATSAAATAIVCTGAFAANTVTATTDVNVRSGPGNSYSVLTVMSKGTSTTQLGSSGNWIKVTVNGKTGYVYNKYLSGSSTSSSSSTTTTTTTSTSKTVYVTASALNVRSGPSTSYSVIGSLKKGSSASVVGTSGSWYKIKYGSGYGYISSSYTSSSSSSSSSSTSTVTSTSTTTSSSSSSSSIVSFAKSLLGCSYSYGAAGPTSFDCSGFTQYVYKHCGISIPRTSSAQYASATKISKSQLQAGDLVFFTSSSGSSVGHVAIYIGNGQIIHAANSSTGVCISSMNSTYYTSHYVGCGRY